VGPTEGEVVEGIGVVLPAGHAFVGMKLHVPIVKVISSIAMSPEKLEPRIASKTILTQK